MLDFSMGNREDHAWDFLSGSEAEAVDRARDELRGQAWAQPLLRDIPATADLTRADKARLFELRFARALHRAGIAPRYEIAGPKAVQPWISDSRTVARIGASS
jgi:hypothetical protein